MRGPDIHQDTLFSTVSPESRVPKDHPLRPIRAMADEALRHSLAGDVALLALVGIQPVIVHGGGPQLCHAPA